MPDTTWLVNGYPPGLSRSTWSASVSMPSESLSTRRQRFTFVRLLGPHLTRSRRAFPATLSTPALDRRTLRWFAASPRRAAAEDHRPDGRPLHLRCSTASVASILYIDIPSAFVVTHQAEIYFSIAQRKVLQPNDFADLNALEQRLLAFGRHYEQIASCEVRRKPPAVQAGS